MDSDFNAFLRIGVDNRATCFVGKIEMGQGPIASFAQMVAEELDVAYASVDMVYARILRPPAHGARRISVDTAAAERMKGVQVIRDGNLSCTASRPGGCRNSPGSHQGHV